MPLLMQPCLQMWLFSVVAVAQLAAAVFTHCSIGLSFKVGCFAQDAKAVLMVSLTH